MNSQSDIHSCSYYCDRPECIKAQRDELRDAWERVHRSKARMESLRNLAMSYAKANGPDAVIFGHLAQELDAILGD